MTGGMSGGMSGGMTGAATGATWIGADWGTTRLRAWAMDDDGRVLAEAASDDGMGRLDRDGFAPALDRLVGGWGDLPVLACGMVGAQQGWVEAPYAAVPCAPLADPIRAPGGRDVRILPGLSQAEPPDVMRGEETQIAGVLALRPGWDGTLCLPGSHSKWASVSAGEVVGFRTAMTGEMFAALGAHTVLRHSVATEETDEAAFDAGVAEGLARPDQLPVRLFSLRAEGLLRGLSPEAARSRLSGLLIGAELAATRGWWLGAEVALVGAGALVAAYRRALAAQGVAAGVVPGDDAVRAGLLAARRRFGA